MWIGKKPTKEKLRQLKLARRRKPSYGECWIRISIPCIFRVKQPRWYKSSCRFGCNVSNLKEQYLRHKCGCTGIKFE